MVASSCRRSTKDGRSSGFCQREREKSTHHTEFCGLCVSPMTAVLLHMKFLCSPPSSTNPWAGRQHLEPSVASAAWGLRSGTPQLQHWSGSHKEGGPRCTPPTWAHLSGGLTTDHPKHEDWLVTYLDFITPLEAGFSPFSSISLLHKVLHFPQIKKRELIPGFCYFCYAFYSFNLQKAH